VKLRRHPRQGQTQIIKDQPRDQKAGDCGNGPAGFRCSRGLASIVRERVYTRHTDHTAFVLGDAFPAEKEFAGRTLRYGFTQVVMEATLVEENHCFRRS